MTRRDRKIEELRQVPGFRTLSSAELKTLARLAEECEVPEGTVLMREGEVARESCVIMDGWATVTIGGVPVAVAGPGQHLGEMAMLDRGPRTATVTAKTPLRVMVVGPEAFTAFAAEPGVARSMAAGLSKRLRAVDANIATDDRGNA